jgi:glutamine synthetase
LAVLPWRPGPGRGARFYCDIKNPDGSAFLHDGRMLLERAVERTAKMGYSCKIGAECEFYLFKTDENGEPSDIPFDNGGYFDMAPLDRGENIRREICLTLEEMGLNPETSHHEQGPGQNEIDFKYSDAITCADNLQTFKSVVKAVATRNGLFASFMPKPVLEAAGSGLHINLSLSQNGKNIFKNASEGHSDIAESFIAGILSRISEITLFLNPLTNSYERFGRFEAPKYISWSHQNRSQLVRIPAATGDKVRMELRSPDPALNPYLSFALIIEAGLDGIQNNMTLPPAVDADLYAVGDDVTKTLEMLPDSLDQAIVLAEDSGFVKNVTGEELLQKYLSLKKSEASDFAYARDKERFYKERYFSII